jgi:hypothetical protein
MEPIVNVLELTRNEGAILTCLVLATFRVYLEVVGFDFSKLPLTNWLARGSSDNTMKSFHRMGLIFSVGYILLFAPGFLLR